MAFTVNLENCTEPVLKVSKTGITTIESCTGTIVDGTGLVNPQIKIEVSDPANVESANYFSISGDIVRHFWITEKRSITNNLWVITGKADLRYTFADAIRASTGIVSRNENFYNMYLQDERIPVMAKPAQAMYKFSNTPFSRNVHEVLLITAGGK